MRQVKRTSQDEADRACGFTGEFMSAGGCSPRPAQCSSERKPLVTWKRLSGFLCSGVHRRSELKSRAHLFRHARAVALWGAVLVFGAETTRGTVYYVRTNGNDTLSGTSWGEAKRSVGASIAAAANGDEIWVAAGTYFENVTFKPGLALYGGFAGAESARDQRNGSNHLSILWGTTNKAVVTITNAGPATRLDGFTVGGGNAIHGGGIIMIGSGPVIANNTIRNNITDGAGAGISVWGFHLVSRSEAHFPVITNNLIVENQSINDEGDGGGIAVVGSSPLIGWNVIARNTATRNGGGIACWRHSLPLIANNFIEANSASYDEGTASSGGGGIFAAATDLDGRPIDGAVSAPTIINNVIAANGGRHGGGITVVDSRLGAPTIANNTVVANNGAGIYWANTWPTNVNNIVAFNARGFERGVAGTSDAEIRFNDVFGNAVLGAPADFVGTADRVGTEGNLAADPRFANRAIGDFHLQPGSPCVNAGSAAVVGSDQWDMDRQPRILGGGVDMGADESAGTRWNVPTPIIHVSSRGDGADGLTWATAKRTVAEGIAQASETGGEVWVAQGTYPEHLTPPAFVYLYGGFVGNETNRSARDPAAHPTILDGGGVPTVVYYRNAGFRLGTLDGFTVQNGGVYTGGDLFNADLTNRFGARGGGIYCRVCAPDIRNNLICSNSIGDPYTSFESYGGGVYGYLAHATIRGNTFVENEVLQRGDGNGGGIYCRESMANIEGNIFERNQAANGAAVYGLYSELRVADNAVLSNALYHTGPPLYVGSGEGALTFLGAPDLLIEANTIQGNTAIFGAGLKVGSCHAARVRNNLILDNLAYDFSGFGGGGQGGGLYCDVNVNATGTVVIANNTLVGNSAPPTILGHGGGGMALTLYTNGLILANNIVVSNSSGIWRYPYFSYQPVLENNCVNNSNANYVNLPAGSSDLQADPQFISRTKGDFHLLAPSPCIDAGTASPAPPTDKDGVRRPLDGRAAGAPGFDIGAFEFVHPQADTDRDGMRDSVELIAGTDPTNPLSALKLSASWLSEEHAVVLRWDSVLGRTYQLSRAATLDPTNGWQQLAENLEGTGRVMEYREAVSATTGRFYRLQVQKNPAQSGQ